MESEGSVGSGLNEEMRYLDAIGVSLIRQDREGNWIAENQTAASLPDSTFSELDELGGSRECPAHITRVDEGDAGTVFLIKSLAKPDGSEEDFAQLRIDYEKLVHGVSHDLQEPVRGITNYVKLLEKRLQGSLDEKAELYFSFVNSEAKRLQSMMKDLVAYSRAGVTGQEFEKIDPVELIDQIKRPALTAAGLDDDSIVVKTPCADFWLPAASAELLFRCVIDNSVKFRSEERPLKVEIEIEPSGQDRVLVSVVDNGIGIDEKNSAYVFDIFRRLFRRSQFSGNGIGLSLAKRIVESAGGQIRVEPVQVGAKICFTLPAQRPLS